MTDNARDGADSSWLAEFLSNAVHSNLRSLVKINRGAAPGSSLEFNAHGERAGWAHDVDAGSVVVVARRAVAGFVEGVLEIGQLSTPI